MWMFARYPLISRLTIFVLLPALTTSALAWWHLRQGLPLQQGEIQLPQLAKPIEINRDAHGIPHIVASSDRDAFFAVGFVHAQDRMWQLELQRRIAQGRMSEVFGKSSVEEDVWFRTLGLAAAARSAWTALSPAAQESLQAYADGINCWLATQRPLPVEFSILGITPEPWTVYDSLAWVKVFALNLGGNHRVEIERLLVGQVIDRSQLSVLFPEYPQQAVTTIAAPEGERRERLERFARLRGKLETQLQIGGPSVGSNAWAVSGKLTRDGTALLANDPHLGLQIPSLWYMAALKGERIDSYGAMLVGLPIVIFGRNTHIAWGGTNLMADAQDIYFEQTKPDDNSRYDLNGEWVSFELTDELIHVKQDFPAFLRSDLKPLHLQVRRSRHGPIISDFFRVFDQPAALRWTALDPGDTTYEAFYRLNYAADWSSFQEALRFEVAPALDVMYADRDGNIGRLAVGRIPIRKNGTGMVAVAGWNDEYAWDGAIPFEQLPRSYNPESGYLVSANNKVVADDYPYLVTRDWGPPYRADRITALLQQAVSSGKPLDLESMRRIQSDVQSEPARRLLARLLQHQPTNDQQRRAYKFLTSWQGGMAANSQAATIFNAWTRLLRRELLSDELSGFWNKRTESRYLREVIDDVDLDNLHRILTEDEGKWCDDKGTTERDTCDDALDGSLNDALWELLKITRDESMQSWTWGRVHQTVYRHTPFSRINILRGFFERQLSNAGSPDTVNVASYAFDKSDGYSQYFGASLRQLFKLGPDGIEHLYMGSTGQSGNFMSSHYDDMVEPFRNVEFLSLRPPAERERMKLTLTPQSSNTRRVQR
jgi:penicillin amidase